MNYEKTVCYKYFYVKLLTPTRRVILFFMAQQPLECQGLFIIRCFTIIFRHQQSVRLLWTSDQPDPDTSTWQHTPLTRNRLQLSRWDSSPQSQQARDSKPTPYTRILVGSYVTIYQEIAPGTYPLSEIDPRWYAEGILSLCGTKILLPPLQCATSYLDSVWTSYTRKIISNIILPSILSSPNNIFFSNLPTKTAFRILPVHSKYSSNLIVINPLNPNIYIMYHQL